MAIEIKMPQLGESVTEGTIGRWLKRPGEPVTRYEPLLEVVTDKVDTEVPCPVAGTLLEVLVPEGETVRVGTVIARVGAADAVAADAPAQAPAAAPHPPAEPPGAPRPPAAAELAAPRPPVVAAPRPSVAGEPAGPRPPAAAAPHPSAAAIAEAGNGAQSRNSFLSPVVARLVSEHGLDPAAIPGTGQGGRVTKHDVLRFIEGREAAGGPEATVSASREMVPHASPQWPSPPDPLSRARERGDHQSTAVPDQHSHQAGLPSPVPGEGEGVRGEAVERARTQALGLPEDAELVPLSPMRRSIAEHMERSVRTAPHVTTVMEVDLGRVLAHREASRAAFERQGVRLTVTPYIVQAVAAGLAAVPVLNGSFTEQGIVLSRRIHIGVAVALDEGLLVPVVRDADEKSLLGLARTVGDLAGRARSRRLQPDETQGGTFTVTNHGVTGSVFATPIINQPQAAILGVGAIVKRPVVVSQSGLDAIAIRPISYLSLTFDHRIADGATADAFLAAVRRALEEYG